MHWNGKMDFFQIRRKRRLLSSERTILKQFGRVLERKRANCGLHPLIHTLLKFNLVQDFGGWQDMLLRDSDATMII
jgi:hypothetical protein